MKNSVTLSLVLFCFLLTGFTHVLFAQNMKKRLPVKPLLKHDYAVKIVAGTQKEKCSKEIGKGVYCTIVNIYNPNPSAVVLHIELVLTRPMGQNGESTNIAIGYDTLMSNHAIQIQPTDYLAFDPNIGYLEGFLTVRSSETLEISTVYTASEFGSKKIESLDIETISQTNQPIEIVEELGKPDLIPVPFMDGNYLHSDYNTSGYYRGEYEYKMKIRNIGTKSCGPFMINLVHRDGIGPSLMRSGWLSGLRVDEEKVLVMYIGSRPNSTSPVPYEIEVDVNNLVIELVEENNTIDTKVTNFAQ